MVFFLIVRVITCSLWKLEKHLEVKVRIKCFVGILTLVVNLHFSCV